jgi:hypothetical protein
MSLCAIALPSPQLLLLGTIRNTGKRGAKRPTFSNGASLGTGMCALALVAHFR